MNLHAGLVELFVILTVIAWLSGRLLGVRRGILRVTRAGLVGLVVGQILITMQFGEHEGFDTPSDLFAHGTGFVGTVLLVTMITRS